MATHNKGRIVGYLKDDPRIIVGADGSKKALMNLCTVRRRIQANDESTFEDVMVFYDDIEWMDRIETLIRYDVVDITGVINILTINKPHICPKCGQRNVKVQGTSSFLYPLSIRKIGNWKDEENPNELLRKHYQEVSNEILLLGTLVTPPDMATIRKNQVCRYKLGVDRKYYVRTQDEITADYPWIYTYGEQADRDFKYLRPGAVVLINGAPHVREVSIPTVCPNCGAEYRYADIVTDFIPYSVEYLAGHKTDADIEEEEAIARRKRMSGY